MNDRPLIQAEELSIGFPIAGETFHAVRNVSFSLGRERLGIVGESGSGKSTLCRALLGLVPRPGQVTADKLMLDDEDLLKVDERGWQRIRGRKAGLIMQDPKYSLNPVVTVGSQIAEAFRVHHGLDRAAARMRTLDALDAVRIRDPERVYGRYPHEVSGGMGQRVMIAMMLAPKPAILIADEPTSALDVTIAAQVLAILDDLVVSRGMGLILISHDLDLVGRFCDRVIVMYQGRAVETLEAAKLDHATHPYTRGLLAARPRLDAPVSELAVLKRDPAWSAG